MRAFWALIAVLVVAAGAVLLLRRPAPAPAALPDISTTPDRAPELAPIVPTPTPTPPPTKPVAQTPAPALDTAIKDAAAGTGVKVDLPAPSIPTPAPTPAPAATPAAPTSEKPLETPSQKPRVEPDPIAEPADAGPLGVPDVPVGVSITREDDGSLMVDHRFVVRGSGTAEKPYEIAWEFLISASETYKPRLGQKKLPDWLELINNKHVRITGYVAFPIMAQSPDEMLVMLNQWDGCCIGVPPTPYDAVEIKLKDAVKGDDRLKTFGTVEGVFTVDPYLVKDWLIGLYIMKDARLTNTTGNQTSPHVTKPQP